MLSLPLPILPALAERGAPVGTNTLTTRDMVLIGVVTVVLVICGLVVDKITKNRGERP